MLPLNAGSPAPLDACETFIVRNWPCVTAAPMSGLLEVTVKVCEAAFEPLPSRTTW